MNEARGVCWVALGLGLAIAGCGGRDDHAAQGSGAGTGASAGSGSGNATQGGGAAVGGGGATSGGSSAGGTGTGGTGTGGTGTGGTGTGGTGTGGTDGGLAGEPATGGAAGGGTRSTGRIQFGTILQYPSPGRNYNLATATFARGGQASNASSSASCQTMTFGACSVTTCSASSDTGSGGSSGQGAATTPAPTAGEISISTDSDTFSAMLEPGATGAYSSASVSGYLTGGESVTVSAAGGDVPAFTHTLSNPLVMLLTAPAVASGEGMLTVPRTADLVLEWDRGVTGAVFQVQSTSSGTTAPFLLCTAPAESGTMTLEAAALDALQAGTELLLFGGYTEMVNAGEYQVDLISVGTVMNPSRDQRISIVLE